jgi:hypothetical protein
MRAEAFARDATLCCDGFGSLDGNIKRSPSGRVAGDLHEKHEFS